MKEVKNSKKEPNVFKSFSKLFKLVFFSKALEMSQNYSQV